jgi:dihydropteroate synthase
MSPISPSDAMARQASADFGERRDRFLEMIGKRRLVMGILNTTPDSFSDGGRYLQSGEALRQADRMIAAGCDIVDVGGESTRPGAIKVEAEEEWMRVEPVLAGLASRPTAVSIDTYKASIASRACQSGAIVVNDIWGLQNDPDMAGVIARSGAAAVLMHNRTSKDERLDLVADLFRFFDHSLDLARRAGIEERRIILDPGVGFGKTRPQQVEAVAAIAPLKRRYGLPVLIGLSRKSFLSELAGDTAGDRLIGTIAANLAAAAAGADIVRVHDVSEHIAALRTFDAIFGRLALDERP